MAIMAMRKNVIPQAPMHKGIVCPTKPTLLGTQSPKDSFTAPLSSVLHTSTAERGVGLKIIIFRAREAVHVPANIPNGSSQSPPSSTSLQESFVQLHHAAIPYSPFPGIRCGEGFAYCWGAWFCQIRLAHLVHARDLGPHRKARLGWRGLFG